jgi:hypothetical protein
MVWGKLRIAWNGKLNEDKTMADKEKETYKDIASSSREDQVKAMENTRRELLREIEAHQKSVDAYTRTNGFKVSGE